LAVLVSRRLPSVDLPQEVLSGRLQGVFDDELAFRLDETEALLAARELGADAAAVQEATGGWAAGIVFEAMREAGAPLLLPPAEGGPALRLPGRPDPGGPLGAPPPRAHLERRARRGAPRAARPAPRRPGRAGPLRRAHEGAPPRRGGARRAPLPPAVSRVPRA